MSGGSSGLYLSTAFCGHVKRRWRSLAAVFLLHGLDYAAVKSFFPSKNKNQISGLSDEGELTHETAATQYDTAVSCASKQAARLRTE